MRPAARKRLKELGYPTYARYLSSPHWGGVKRAWLASGLELRCFVCGTDRGVHLHHSSYQHLGCEQEHLEELIPLCNSHHRGLHNFVKHHRLKPISAHHDYKEWVAGEGRFRKPLRP